MNAEATAIARKLSWSDRLLGFAAATFAYIAARNFSLEKTSKMIGSAKRYCQQEMTPEEAEIAWHAVRQPGCFWLGRVACLELSLAMVIFAIAKRRAVTWCIGTATEPFQSHAWVEVDKKPFRESDKIAKSFRKLVAV